jgi:putative transposase
MRENGLRARQKRRFKRTTDSNHNSPVAPNLLDQDFSAEGPDQKWGSDISYIWTREGWLYLAVYLLDPGVDHACRKASAKHLT